MWALEVRTNFKALLGEHAGNWQQRSPNKDAKWENHLQYGSQIFIGGQEIRDHGRWKAWVKAAPRYGFKPWSASGVSM